MIKHVIYFSYFVIFLINSFNLIKAEECEIKDKDGEPIKWGENKALTPINDTVYGVIATFDTSNVERVDRKSGDYLDVVFNKETQKLEIKTTEAYKKYEETNVYDSIIISLDVICTGSTTKENIRFTQKLIDVNTHKPKFPKVTYEYKLPMPWPKSLDITLLEEIIVTDIDFSNRKISYEIDKNDYLEIIENPSIDSKYKQYPATLRPKRSLNLEDDLSLKIYATDEKDVYGTQWTEEATVKILIDKDGSVPPAPRFEKLVYEGKYDDSNTIELEEIIIEKETFVESIQIEINGEYSKNFNIVNVKDNKYQLEIKENLPSNVWETETYISLELKIKNEPTGSSVILTLEGEKAVIPIFEKRLYEGIYLDTDKIDMENLVIVKETYEESVEIDITGRYSENFNVKHIKDNTYQLEVKKPLPSDVWNSEKLISLELEIKGENTGTVVVLTSEVENSPEPRFEKYAYEGKYLENDQIELEDLIIVEDTYVESINIEVTGKYSKNFKVNHVKNNKFQLEVKEPLPSAVLESENYVSLILEIEGKFTGTAVVLTIDGKVNTPIPRFEKLVYEGKYSDEGKIDLEDLVIVKDTYVESIDIGISGTYSDNFQVKHVKDNTYQLEVKEPLPSAVLDSENYVSLILEIEGEFTGTAVVLTIDGKGNTPIPRFEKLVYEGKYSDEGKINLEDLVIVKETYVESIDIGISGTYSENFQIKHVKDNVYLLEVKKPLPSAVLESENYVSLTLEIEGQFTGTAVVLTIDGKGNTPIPRFEKLVYEGKYSDDGKINLEDLVIVKDTYVESIDIGISGTYSKNFQIKHVKDNTYQLQVKEPLPSAVLESENFVSLILEIEGEFTGTAVVLTLDGKANTPIPRFEKLVYEGKYNDDDKIDLEDLVIVEETYLESMEIESSGKYSDYFNVQQVEDNKYRLENIKPLPSTVWELEKYVSLTVEIQEKNTGTTIVLTSGVKKFEKLVYQGKYYDTDKIDLEDLVIDGEELTEPININITGEYSENFVAKQFKNNKYQLNIQEPLPTSVWDSEEYISLKLNIKEIYTGTTVALTLQKIDVPADCKLPLSFLEPVEVVAIISSDFNGEISSKRAVDFPESKIEYSVKNKPKFVEIEDDTGIVTIKNDGYIQQDTYEFEIIAKNKLSETSSYKIILHVNHKSITSQNALSVKTIPENKSIKSLIELNEIDKKQNCKFEIKNTEPKGNWFVVNKDSGNIDVNAINRDDKLFDAMYLEEIQVQLTLNIDCGKTEAKIKFRESFNSSMYGTSFAQALNHELRNQQNTLSYNYARSDVKEDDKYQWIYTKEISDESEQMIVNVRVENTDNHPPSFIDVSPLHIGYPSMEAIEVIHPPFVYQVHAIDKDIGLNGIISYEFESKSYFIIHPKTGVIYPSKELSNLEGSTKIDLSVIAVDQEGKGLSSKPLSITVHLLDTKQISILKIEKGLIEDLSDILTKISEKTEWSVQQLTSAVIPESTKESDDASRFLTKLTHKVTNYLASDNTDTLLTIYTHAFDDQFNIISADDFVEKLENIKFEGVDWTVNSVEPHSNNVTSITVIKKEQSKGLLVAVIIVSIAFVCYIVGSIFFLKSRNRKNDNVVLTTKPADNVEHDLSNVNPRLSVLINDNLIGSSNSDGDESKGNTLRVNNPIRERKKSNVTFNDEVEQIEIKFSETHQSNSFQ